MPVVKCRCSGVWSHCCRMATGLFWPIRGVPDHNFRADFSRGDAGCPTNSKKNIHYLLSPLIKGKTKFVLKSKGLTNRARQAAFSVLEREGVSRPVNRP